MLEKILLAITITFSLSLFCQVRILKSANAGSNYQPKISRSATILE
jgi:hypothetical protein